MGGKEGEMRSEWNPSNMGEKHVFILVRCLYFRG